MGPTRETARLPDAARRPSLDPDSARLAVTIAQNLRNCPKIMRNRITMSKIETGL